MPKPRSKPVGERIKQLRKEKGYSLEDLAKETGCSVEYLDWVEKGQVFPPVALLLQLARALELDSGAFLKDGNGASRRAKEQAKRTAHYSYKLLTPAKGDKHLMAFAITIPAKDEHSGVGYRHEGEEFVYVVAGEVVVTVGENKNHLKVGDSLHFNANIPHHMANPSQEKTELLVILYVP